MAFEHYVILDVFFLKWRGAPERGDVARILHELREARSHSKKPLAFIWIVPADSELPNENVRRELKELLEPALSFCSGIHLVILGKGFKSAAQRSVALGMALKSKQSQRLTVHDRLELALQAARVEDLDTILAIVAEYGI